MSVPIWLNDPTILLKHDKLNEFWPITGMTIEEKINSITRLVIILTILGYLLTLSLKIVSIGLITLISISLIYLLQNRSNFKKKEYFSNKLSSVYPELTNPITYQLKKNDYSKPTENNPLMNVLIPEIHYDPKRKPAAPAFNNEVEKQINNSVKKFVEKPFNDDNIGKKLFGDLADELMFDRSMISWSSTANTEVPNDQKAFQEYAYGSMISGKEGNPLALERHSSGAYNHTMY
tara:strand:- start:587 stop:1288 length:702 start_codon:yes stop_codon:yes gene_type:complete